MKRIAFLAFTFTLMLTALASAQNTDTYPTTLNFDNISTTVALSSWATANYFMHEQDAQLRGRFAAGAASYLLVDMMMNKNSEPSVGRSIAAVFVTSIVNTGIGYGINGWNTERALATVGGATTGFVATFSIRF